LGGGGFLKKKSWEFQSNKGRRTAFLLKGVLGKKRKNTEEGAPGKVIKRGTGGKENILQSLRGAMMTSGDIRGKGTREKKLMGAFRRKGGYIKKGAPLKGG